VDPKNLKTLSNSTNRLDSIIFNFKNQQIEKEVDRSGVISTDFKLKKLNPFMQFLYLYQRSLRNVLRDYPKFFYQFLNSIFLGVFLGFLQFQLGHDQTGALDRLGCLANLVGVFPFMSILAGIVSCNYCITYFKLII
jgi:hypothetical protein